METEYATCETPECPSRYVPIPFMRTEGVLVTCGACGNEITNITDLQPTEGTVLPEWILEQLATQNSGN